MGWQVTKDRFDLFSPTTMIGLAWLMGYIMPAILVIDKQGQVIQSYYAGNMRDYPSNSELLTAIDAANAPAS